MKRTLPELERDSVGTTTADSWGPRRRLMISLLLALHVTAIFAAPCAYPPPSSDLAQRVAGWFDRYLFAAYLNHGYRFFAPNPGPSHLVRFEVISLDGDGIHAAGRFPELQDHWPRLLYHRHFMISETMYTETNIPLPPEEGFASEEEQAAFLDFRAAARAQAEVLLQSVSGHLRRRHGGGSVRLYVQEHLILSPLEVLDGVPLDAPELYRERYLGEFDMNGKWTWPEAEDVGILKPLHS